MVRGMSSPTGTLEDLTEADRTGSWRHTKQCQTGDLLAALPMGASASVIQALVAPNAVASTAEITKRLIRNGVPAKTENVGRHRRRLQGKSYGCKCPLPSGVSS